jgi:hypothetical protein
MSPTDTRDRKWRQQDAIGTFSGWVKRLELRNLAEIDGIVGYT